MKKLYNFYTDCGMDGRVEGLFIAHDYEVKRCIGEYVRFGRILGKYSDVDGHLESHEFTIKSEDEELLNKLESIFGRNISGYNPLDYVR